MKPDLKEASVGVIARTVHVWPVVILVEVLNGYHH